MIKINLLLNLKGNLYYRRLVLTIGHMQVEVGIFGSGGGSNFREPEPTSLKYWPRAGAETFFLFGSGAKISNFNLHNKKKFLIKKNFYKKIIQVFKIINKHKKEGPI